MQVICRGRDLDMLDKERVYNNDDGAAKDS